ncbi:hypothetical protein ACVWU4_000947 [Campylobacter coli]
MLTQHELAKKVDSRKSYYGEMKSSIIGGIASVSGSLSKSNTDNITAHAESVGFQAVESTDSNISAANSDLTSISKNIIDSINAVNTLNNMPALKAHEESIVRGSVALSLDPAASISKIQSAKYASIDANSGRSFLDSDVGVTDSSILDVYKGAKLHSEAFDGQSLNNAIYFSVIYNLGMARQDDFAEALFPIIPVDPFVVGASIDIELASFYTEFKRLDRSGSAEDQFNKKPLVKHLYDNELLQKQSIKAIPIVDTKNSDKLLHNLKSGIKGTTYTGDTAPIKAGVEVNLLSVSQSDLSMAKGVTDETDALSSSMWLKNVYYSIKHGDVASGTPDHFVQDVTIFSGNEFYAPRDGHNKDAILNMREATITFVIGMTKDYKGNASAVNQKLAESYAGYKVIYSFAASGDANTQSGNVKVYFNGGKIKEIYSANGTLISKDSSEFTGIEALLNGNLEIVGYDLEASRTNSNFRDRGLMLTVDRYTHYYSIPWGTPVTSKAPITNAQGNDNDAVNLAYQVTVTGFIMSSFAVSKLVNECKLLEQATADGTITNLKTKYIGNRLLNHYYKKVNLSLVDIINSIESHDKPEDVKAALTFYIQNEINIMFPASNYAQAIQTLQGNEVNSKVTVICATDFRLKSILTLNSPSNRISLNDKFDLLIVDTFNELMKDKIILTFGIFNEKRNIEPNPLNVGQCWMSPTLNIDFTANDTSAKLKECYAIPRFRQEFNFCIFSELNLTNIDDAYAKIKGLQQIVHVGA